MEAAGISRRFTEPAMLVASVALFIGAAMAGWEATPLVRETAVYAALILFALVIARHLVLLYLAVGNRHRHPGSERTDFPAITVVMPAYNEESVVADALGSLLRLDYPNYDVLVIDDGSSDRTAEVARDLARGELRVPVKVISQANGGKAAALNTGIRHAQGEFIVCVDSDSRLEADALANGLGYFDDPRVGAVGGFIEVANNHRLICRFQQLEYLLGLNFFRRALSVFGAVTVVPGPIGMFRRRALQDAGGYREGHDIYAEDADLTVRLLARGWRVTGATDMVSHTEAPESLFDLLRQRYRWKRGIYQAFRGNLYGLITGPELRQVWIAVLLAFESFLLDILNFTVAVFFFAHLLRFGEISLLLSWFLVLVVLDLLTVVFVCRGRGFFLRWVFLLVLQKLTYAYVLLAWGVFALFDEWLAQGMSWDKLERAGRLGRREASS